MSVIELATLWDDREEVVGRIVAAFARAVPINMVNRVRIAGPAVYAVLLGPAPTGLAADLLAPIAGTGQPAYVGSQTGPDCRVARHRLSVAGARTLALADWWTAVVAMRSPEEALAAESLLAADWTPIMNQPQIAGMGSNRQGRGRATGQSASPWDVVFDTSRPGRSSAVDRERARTLRAFIRQFLAGDPHRPPLIDPRLLT